MNHYTQDELTSLGFKSIGSNVMLSKKTSLYGIGRISIGDNTRIDDFCIISAGTDGIDIGSHVHIACYVSLIGNGRIVISDFAGVSSRCSVYSSNDDYSGNFLTGPQIRKEFLNVLSAPVLVGKHVVVGAGSVILPGVTLGEGGAIGAMSLVTKSVGDFEIHAGVPARFIKQRSRKLQEIEHTYLASLSAG